MAAISGIGTVTSVGLTAVQTGASVRAGISRLHETEWDGQDGNPYRGGFVPEDLLPRLHRKTFDVPEDSTVARMLRLAGPALTEAAATLPSRGESVGLILGLRSEETLEGVEAEIFLENLKRQSRVRLDSRASRIVFGGRTAGLLAIQEGARLIAGKTVQSVLAGGIDSYYDYPRLMDLDFEGRILNDANLDGFLPGEGAGFVALVPPSRPAETPLLGTIVAAARGYEPGHIYSEEPMSADGLTRTLADLFDQVSSELLPCPTAYVNLTGEHIEAKEWAVASRRNRSFLGDAPALLHPAEAFGEAGAAMGPIMVALAIRGWVRGYHTGPVLVACLDDRGERAAICLAPNLVGGPGNA